MPEWFWCIFFTAFYFFPMKELYRSCAEIRAKPREALGSKSSKILTSVGLVNSVATSIRKTMEVSTESIYKNNDWQFYSI